MNSVKEDVKATIKMVNSHNQQNHFDKLSSSVPKDAGSFSTYSKVFPFTNEKIRNYYKKFNYDGNILTVVGSGDNILHSILMGCKNITAFDINKLTKYYTSLKIAAVKRLPLNMFIEYFSRGGYPGYPEMTYSIFKIIEEDLDEESREFWNRMYASFDIDKNIEFQQGFFYQDGSYFNNSYIEKNNYEKLKNNLLEEPEIKIINSDILLLSDEELDDNYTSIFLSNIYDYIENDEYYKIFIEDKLAKKVTDGGKILYDYSWNFDTTPPYKGRNYTTISVDKTTCEKAYVYTKRKKQNK